MELLRLLKDAREILTPTRTWTTGTLARGDMGIVQNASSRLATSWCMVGALDRAASCNGGMLSGVFEEGMNALRMAIPKSERPRQGVSGWNDRKNRTHAQVLACYDRAIAQLEKQQEKAK